MTKKLSTPKKILNGAFDLVKGTFQLFAFQGGVGGFLAGALYGLTEGVQDMANGKNFSWVKMATCAATGLLPVAGPFLMGATSSSLDQAQNGSKIDWKETLLNAIPFIGPIAAGVIYRNKRLEKAASVSASATPDAPQERTTTTPDTPSLPARVKEQAAEAAGQAAAEGVTADTTEGSIKPAGRTHASSRKAVEAPSRTH